MKQRIEQTALIGGAIAIFLALTGAFSAIANLLLLIAGIKAWSIALLLRFSAGMIAIGVSGSTIAAIVFHHATKDEPESPSEPEPVHFCRQCGTCKYFNRESPTYLWCAVHPQGPKEERCRDFQSIL